VKISRANAFAALWGVAEATLFFIVPDVLLGWLALRSPKKGLIACVYALIGALAGGAIMWVWGRSNPDAARAIFESLPAIGNTTISNVQTQIANSGIAALFLGPIGGTPYKIYAVEAANLGYGLVPFLAVSIPSRLARFVIVTAVSGGISQLLLKRLSMRTVRIIYVSCWLLFYAWFFTVMAD
jgi:hypothetical protein